MNLTFKSWLHFPLGFSNIGSKEKRSTIEYPESPKRLAGLPYGDVHEDDVQVQGKEGHQ